MKKLIFLSLMSLCAFTVSAQNYSSPGIPSGTNSTTPTFRIKPATPDSLAQIWLGIGGNKFYRLMTGMDDIVFSVVNFKGAGTTSDKLDLNDNVIITGTMTAKSGMLIGGATDTAGHSFSENRLINGVLVREGFGSTKFQGGGAAIATFYGTSQSHALAVPALMSTPFFSSDSSSTWHRIPVIDTFIGATLDTVTHTLTVTGGGGTVITGNGVLGDGSSGTPVILGGGLNQNTTITTGATNIFQVSSTSGLNIATLQIQSGILQNTITRSGHGSAFSTYSVSGSDPVSQIGYEDNAGTGYKTISFGIVNKGAYLLDSKTNLGLLFASDYSTNQRANLNSAASVKTVIALADSVKGTIGGVTGANPTATAGTSAVNGSAPTFMRSDAAPKVDSTVFRTVANSQTLAQTQTALNLKSNLANPTFTGTVTIPNGGVFGTPTSMTATNVTGLPLTTGVTGILPVANGGTGTASPGIVAGTNVTVTGTWPNQTVNASGGGGISGLTTNYIPKATSSTTIGNSLLYDDGTGEMLGTTVNSGYQYDQTGTARFQGQLSESKVAEVSATPTATPSTTGGTLAANTYYAKIVAVDAQGNLTAPSGEVSATTTGTTGSIAYNWTTGVSLNASRYRIYIGTAAGAENIYYTTTNGGDATTTFTYTGATSTAGSPPAVNNTGLSFLKNDGTILLQSTTPSFAVATARYNGAYKSGVWMQNNAAAGITLGNDATNYIAAGSNDAGGTLQIWTNNSAAFGSIPNGNNALDFDAPGNATFNKNVTITGTTTLNGTLISNINTTWGTASGGLFFQSALAGTNMVYERLSNTGGNVDWGIVSSTGTGLPGSAYDMSIGTESAHNVVLFANNLERMRIFSGGNVAIASTTDNGNGILQLTGSLALETAGNKINIATGTNSILGNATLSSGTVTVSNTSVTASSLIFFSYKTPSGTTGSLQQGTIVAGTSFVINSQLSGALNTADNSTVNYFILN